MDRQESTTQRTINGFGAGRTYFFPADDMARFAGQGLLYLSSYFANIVVEYDLEQTGEGLRTVCQMPGWYRKSVVQSPADHFTEQEQDYRTIAPALKEMDLFCSANLASFDLVVDLATGPQVVPMLAGEATQWIPGATRTDHEEPRETRQVIAGTIVASLIAGVSGWIWGSSHSSSQTDDALMKNQKHLIQVLRKDEHRGITNTATLNALKQVVNDLVIHQATAHTKTGTAYTMLATMVNHCHDLEHVLEAIKVLILHHRFSPNLFHKDQLKNKLDHLRHQAEAKGLDLGTDTETDFFLAEASYATFPNLTIRGVAHLPLIDRQEQFNLFKFIPSPVRLTTGHTATYVEVHLEDQHLAITSSGDRYILLSATELERLQDHGPPSDLQPSTRHLDTPSPQLPVRALQPEQHHGQPTVHPEIHP